MPLFLPYSFRKFVIRMENEIDSNSFENSAEFKEFRERFEKKVKEYYESRSKNSKKKNSGQNLTCNL